MGLDHLRRKIVVKYKLALVKIRAFGEGQFHYIQTTTGELFYEIVFNTINLQNHDCLSDKNKKLSEIDMLLIHNYQHLNKGTLQKFIITVTIHFR